MTASLAERVTTLESEVASLRSMLVVRTSSPMKGAHSPAFLDWAAEHGFDPDDFEVLDTAELVMSAKEAATVLGLSVDHVHRLVAEGKIVGDRRRGRGGSILSRTSVEELATWRAAGKAV